VKVEAFVKKSTEDQEKFFAIQILRGPLKSETKEIKLPAGPAKVPIELVLSRITTMYRLEDGSF